ncbi:hypothetical protein Tco_0698722 [Tanacetum coccineum]
MRRLTKGYTGVEIGLFPTMLPSPPHEPSPTLSSSPSRITSSPSPSSEPSTAPTYEPQPSPDAEYHVPTPNESPFHVVYSHGSDEGSLKLHELTTLVTKLSERIEVLEDNLKKTKQTYNSAFTKLILKIKKLEFKVKTGKARQRARVVLSEDEEGYDEVDVDVVHDQDTTEVRQPEDSTAGITVSTAPISFSTARESYSTAGRVYGRRKRQGLEEAIRLQQEVDEEEKAQIARDEEIARQLLELDEERVTTETKTTKDIDWNDPSIQKYWDKKNKTKRQDAQQGRTHDCILEESNSKRRMLQKIVESLSYKYPIWDWKTLQHCQENFMFYNSSRGEEAQRTYKILVRCYMIFDRQDIMELYRLVKESIPADSLQTPIATQLSSSRSQKKQSMRKQRKDTTVSQDETQQDDSVPTPSNDPPLSGEDSMQLSELMLLYTNMQK